MSVARSRRRFAAPLVLGVLVVAAVVVLATRIVTASGKPSPTPPGSPIAHATPTLAATLTLTPTDTPAPPTDTPEPTATPSPTATPVPVPKSPPAIVSTPMNGRDPAGAWVVAFTYPQFAAKSTPLAAAMNADLQRAVELQVVQWEAGAAASLAPGSTHPNTLTGSFTIAYLSPAIASFRIKSVEDLNGAHPATTVQTVTYSLTTGQRLGLGDLFTDMKAGLDALSAQSRTMLRAQLGADYDENLAGFGTEASPDNFAAWAPTPGGLEVTFREYQVASYADGMPRIVVPWSALGKVLSPDGPLASVYGG